MLCPLRFSCLLVLGLIRRIIYKILNECPYDFTGFDGIPRKVETQFNQTSWVAVLMATDLPH